MKSFAFGASIILPELGSEFIKIVPVNVRSLIGGSESFL